MKKYKTFWNIWFLTWGITFAFFFLVFILCSTIENPECDHGLSIIKFLSKGFIFTTVTAYMIFHFINYHNMNKVNDKSVRMKFNHFKDVYYVNPNRWDIATSNWDNGFIRLRYRNGDNYWREDSYYVTFSYFDWLKFLLWDKIDEHENKIKRKRKEEEASNKRMVEMLKYIQKDIDEAYEKISLTEVKK